ncbi:MAG: hypothetical protein NTY77_16455 [Elusimicrobia bacterium]|nr:hypothetical protein [Elusimicrobiota bacterium]
MADGAHEDGRSLPQDVREALSKLDRFENLEIGELSSREPAAAALPGRRVFCHHCGRSNDEDQPACWACHEPIARSIPAAGEVAVAAEGALVIDGVSYRADDPGLPEDVRVLMDRIRKDGYSPELLVDWRAWRLGRNRRPGEAPPPPEVKIFKGQRVSVIRIDGKTYTSDDPALSPQMRQLFAYLQEHGVTPGLMDCLRQLGTKARLRPGTTACPSDGDLAFWQHVQTAPVPGPPEEETELDDSLPSGRFARAKRFAPAAAVAIGLYIVARLLLHSQIKVVDEVIGTVLARILLPF